MRFDFALFRGGWGHVSLEAVDENTEGNKDGVILQPPSPRSSNSLHSVPSEGSSLHLEFSARRHSSSCPQRSHEGPAEVLG